MQNKHPPTGSNLFFGSKSMISHSFLYCAH